MRGFIKRVYRDGWREWLAQVKTLRRVAVSASDGAGELGRSGGFTLLEMILAVTILSVVMIVAFYSFNAAVRSWIAGNDYINGITHADYVLEQIAMGLRSAYYPDTGRVEGTYGMTLIDDGEGPMARDRLTWVKIGSALVGADADYADTPHRIEIAVLDEGDTKADYDGGGFAFRAWRVALRKPPQAVQPAQTAARKASLRAKRPPNDTLRQALKPVTSTPKAAKKSFTTTTPWCRETNSTSPPSHPSWT